MVGLNRRGLIASLMAGPLLKRSVDVAVASEASPNTSPAPDAYVDIRAIIGGDGEISTALRQAMELGKSAWIAPGKYTISGRIDQRDMRIKAAPDAIIQAIGDDNVVFWSSGSISSLPRASVRLVKGKSRLSLEQPHHLQPGDLIVIYNPADFSWHASRPYYRAGEWCRVASVTERSVTLSRPLRDNYAAPDVQLFRIVPRRPALIGGTWQCSGRELVRYTACTGNLIDVERVEAASNTAIYIDRCFEANVTCRYGHNKGSGQDDYLICIGNSQSVRVSGERFYSRRHPVAIGGGDVVCGVPCRDCKVEGLILENAAASNVLCADMHGNADGCSYVKCVIFGGISLAGANPAYRYCKVYARKDGTTAEATELVGGTVDLTGIEVTSTAENVGGGRGLIDIGTQNSAFNRGTRLDLTLLMTDFSINAPNLARDEAIIRIRNTGSNAQLNILVNRGNLRLRQAVQFLRTELASGRDNSKIIELTEIFGLPPQSKLHYAVSGAYGTTLQKSAQKRRTAN